MLVASWKRLWKCYRSQQGHETIGNIAANTLSTGMAQPSQAKNVSACFHLLIFKMKTITACKGNADRTAPQHSI